MNKNDFRSTVYYLLFWAMNKRPCEQLFSTCNKIIINYTHTELPYFCEITQIFTIFLNKKVSVFRYIIVTPCIFMRFLDVLNIVSLSLFRTSKNKLFENIMKIRRTWSIKKLNVGSNIYMTSYLI